MNSLVVILLASVFSSVDRGMGSSVWPDCSAGKNPCLNGGVCIKYGSSYRCACPANCGGDHCGDCAGNVPNDGACAPNPCQRDCQCHESCQHAGGYYCRSTSGYLGKNCTIPVPTLRCESNRIVFSVSESFVREYDLGLRNSYINIVRRLDGTQGCEVTRAVNGLFEIQIPIPFTACGTEMTSVGGRTVYTNQMWFNRRLANSMFDMPIPVAEFQCAYERQYMLVTSLRPVVSTPAVITQRQYITPSISLCKAASCPNACPTNFAVNGRAVYTVGEIIHVSMTLDSGTLVTGVDEMFLSCSPVPSTTNTVGIVHAGCGTTSGLPCTITTNAVGNTVCVSFQTPRSMSCQEFYIHVKLISCDGVKVGVCPDNTQTNRCLVSRRKRSLESAPIAIGPILVVNGSTGIPKIHLSGMEDGTKLELLELQPIVKENIELIYSKDKSSFPSLSAADAPPPPFDGMDQPLFILMVVIGIVLLVVVVSIILVLLRNHSFGVALLTKS